MNIFEKSVPSVDGVHMLSGKVYVPDGDVKGYLQIAHGMTEHIERYDRFMRDMADAGYVTFGYDHLGHGKTAGEGEHGFIASRDGYLLLCRDITQFAREVVGAYGDAPYYLMGHSMGSFIVRLAVTMDAKPDKLIVMGTGGKNPAADIGLKLIGIISKIFGEKHISRLMDKIAFGSYNKRFPGEDEKAWLSSKAIVREKYMADPYCTFKFTISAMGDLVTLNRNSNLPRTFDETPRDLPVLLVSGEDDPVGDYGRGVIEVMENYKAAGVKAEAVLFSSGRHEILNDHTYEHVSGVILEFLK